MGSAGVWLYDGGLQFDIPTGTTGARSPVTPFVQVGVGAATYKVNAASIINTSATNVAFNAGIGLDYQVAPTIAVRLMAKDYVGKFNFKDATSFDIQGRTAQNWALTGGIRIGF
jgi:opacity protein-like surface antigen